MSNLLSLKNITKSYNVAGQRFKLPFFGREVKTTASFLALNQITFDLGPGICMGLLGANGSGKSTLIKIICGIQRPDSGRVLSLGHTPSDRSTKYLQKIGVVFGHKSSFWWDLPARLSFEAYRAIYKIPEEDYRVTMRNLTTALHLSQVLETPVRNLSLGERVKCEIALSLLHAPKLLLLDEPTIGLDVHAKIQIREYLKECVAEGMSILMTSHDYQDVVTCCSSVVVLDKGELQYNGSLERFHTSQLISLTLTKLSKEGLATDHTLIDNLACVQGIHMRSITANRWELSFSKSLMPYITQLLNQHCGYLWTINHYDNDVFLSRCFDEWNNLHEDQ